MKVDPKRISPVRWLDLDGSIGRYWRVGWIRPRELGRPHGSAFGPVGTVTVTILHLNNTSFICWVRCTRHIKGVGSYGEFTHRFECENSVRPQNSTWGPRVKRPRLTNQFSACLTIQALLDELSTVYNNQSLPNFGQVPYGSSIWRLPQTLCDWYRSFHQYTCQLHQWSLGNSLPYSYWAACRLLRRMIVINLNRPSWWTRHWVRFEPS